MATSGEFKTSTFEGRGLRFTWERKEYSIEDASTTINWKVIGDGQAAADYYITGPVEVTINGSVVKTVTTRTRLFIGTIIASGTTTIPHNSDGTKTFAASVRAAVYYTAYNVSGSGTFTLDTIPLLSSLSVPDGGILGTSQILTITRINSAYRETVAYKCGTATGTIATKTSSTSLVFLPPSSLSSQSPSGTEVQIEFSITTYNGSTALGTKKVNKTYAIPSSVAPTISNFTISEAGEVGSFTVYIYGKSKIAWSVTAAGSNGSEIASYNVKIAGLEYSSTTGTTDFIYARGSQTATVTVTDTRGRTATRSITFTVEEYNAPIIDKFECIRTSNGTTPADNGTKLRVNLSFEISRVAGQNTTTFGFGYREQGTQTSFISMQHTIPANTFSYNNHQTFSTVFDPEKSYEIRFAITDKFSTTYRYGYINTAFCAITVSPDRQKIAFFGKYSRDGFECFKNAFFPKGIDSKNTPKLGDYTIINTNSDLDDLTRIGTYIVTNTSGISNLPVAEKGILTVICGSTGIYDDFTTIKSEIYQIYTTFESNKVFKRVARAFNLIELWSFFPWQAVNTEEQNGIWTVKRSGDMVEMWGEQNLTVDVTGQWGGIYGSGDYSIERIAYPFRFEVAPFVQATINRGSSGNMFLGTSGQSNNDLTRYTPYYQVFRGTSGTNQNVKISYYIKGTIL
ncbi:MAG: DUF859 family phage minor structural protein [Clostridia bacterium]|nr:DUF859 family phage minor structural protein [Clostridia bacterium]